MIGTVEYEQEYRRVFHLFDILYFSFTKVVKETKLDYFCGHNRIYYSMKIYYYHTRPIEQALEEWSQGKHPGHILYGLTHFKKYGIDAVVYPYKQFSSRIKMMVYALFTVLRCKDKYDLLYGTSYRGIELIIFLRALGLYRKPIAIWHHQAVPVSKGFFKGCISKLFYRGIDCMFFFSNTLIEDSLKSGKVSRDRMHLIHWGADLDFYDNITRGKSNRNMGFISTGKECRDFRTLLQAFSGTDESIDVYAPKSNGDMKYDKLLDNYSSFSNIRIHRVGGIIPYELAVKVADAAVVVISCLDLSYTVGLTTLVEAFALGKPVICTGNPKFEVDIDAEKVGICVGYKDVDGWVRAIEYMAKNPDKAVEMGKNGRKLAENLYNLDNYTSELSIILKSFSGH